MDASETPTDSKEVELTEYEATTAETTEANQSVDVKITFCTHVGWDGVLILLFSMCIAALFVYITFMYTTCIRVYMAKSPNRKLPHPERCICKHVIGEKPRRPRIYVQPSLYDGVIMEMVCHTCGAWVPYRMEERS